MSLRCRPLRRNEHGKLVTSQPRDGIGPALQRMLEAGGDLTQQQVAHVMAKRVVYMLEPVKVQGEHCERSVAALRGPDRLDHAIVEQCAVRQAREGVGVGKPAMRCSRAAMPWHM